MRHLLDKYIPVVTALHTVLGSFGGTLGLCHFSVITHSARRGESCEVLTTAVGHRASILQCLDRPIENALKLVNFGENWVK